MKTRFHWVVAWVLGCAGSLILLTSHGSARAPMVNGTITGTVTGAGGVPLTGFGVRAGDYDALIACDEASMYDGTTGGDGTYQIDVPAGTYLVYANSHSQPGTYLPEAYADVNSWAEIDTAIPVTVGSGGVISDVDLSLPATNIHTLSAIEIDTVIPTIVSITSTTDSATYKTGDTINVTVTFSEPVELTNGTLRLQLDAGTNAWVDFAEFSLKLFHDVVLKNKNYVDLIVSAPYTLKTYYMGTVDPHNHVNFYDGNVRVVDPEGKEFRKFTPAEYVDVIEERVEPWTYVKLPYLKAVGWKGLVDGAASGVYRVGPLGRLNAAEGMATPLAQQEYERMYETLGGKPVHSTLAFHWARLIELLYAAERAVELSTDEEITSTDLRNEVGRPGEGVGIVEAARGTLIHHYQLDDDALVKRVNLIVATTNNAPAICMSIRDAAKGLIHGGAVNQGLLNRVEMAFRAYDPCLACATHFAVGQMPLQVKIYDHDGTLLVALKR